MQKIGTTNQIRTFLKRKMIELWSGASKNPHSSVKNRPVFRSKGLIMVDGDTVKKAAIEAIGENPQAVADYKAGKEKALNSLVGGVMKKTKRRADARKVREVLIEKLLD